MQLQTQAPGGPALGLAYWSGVARWLELRRGGTGAILRFRQVQPARHGDFQPLRAGTITPPQLDRLIVGLRRWRFEIVSLDEALRRIAAPRAAQRFVCLTFDGADRGVMRHAARVLARRDAPFAVYVPTAFADGVAELWWLALERIIAGHARIGLVIDRRERHFEAARVDEKEALFSLLAGWLDDLAPAARSHAIRDLCARYGVDLDALSQIASMDWDDVRLLASSPLVTIGTATVSGAALHRLDDAQALREMQAGRDAAEAVLDRALPHFAYPDGPLGARELALAGQAGFASAVTTAGGLLWPDGQSFGLALPRIAWDGRRPSLRGLRARLAGIGGR